MLIFLNLGLSFFNLLFWYGHGTPLPLWASGFSAAIAFCLAIIKYGRYSNG